jgi:hypothetical protein
MVVDLNKNGKFNEVGTQKIGYLWDRGQSKTKDSADCEKRRVEKEAEGDEEVIALM